MLNWYPRDFMQSDFFKLCLPVLENCGTVGAPREMLRETSYIVKAKAIIQWKSFTIDDIGKIVKFSTFYWNIYGIFT